jgi:hypothetical protein
MLVAYQNPPSRLQRAKRQEEIKLLREQVTAMRRVQVQSLHDNPNLSALMFATKTPTT